MNAKDCLLELSPEWVKILIKTLVPKIKAVVCEKFEFDNGKKFNSKEFFSEVLDRASSCLEKKGLKMEIY